MPVWGFEFYPEHGTPESARRRAEQTIERLVDYLETIQPEYRKDWRP
jgi:hypothetical protein